MASDPNHDAVCFHAEQCAEKYLKARLAEAENPFPKTHDLGALLDLVLLLEPAWIVLRKDADCLTDMGVEFRYPGTSADAEDARAAVCAAERIRTAMRVALKIETQA